MILQNYYKLKLPFTKDDILIDDNILSKEYSSHSAIINLIPEEALSKNVLNFFKDNNLTKLKVVLFNCPPNFKSQIHIDGHDKLLRSFAINIPWGSSNSVMTWYKTVGSKSPTPNLTMARNPYMYFDEDTVEVIDSTSVNSITMVRTDIPHSIENLDKINARWCVSIRTNDISNWIIAAIRLKEYLEINNHETY